MIENSNHEDLPSETSGERGNFVTKQEIALEQRAIRQQWNIPEELRAEIIDRQLAIASDPETPARDATRAFQAILQANAQNMEQEKRDLQIPDYHEHNINAITPEQRKQHIEALIRERINGNGSPATPDVLPANGRGANGHQSSDGGNGAA